MKAEHKSIVQRQAERRTDEKAAADRAVAGMARRQQPQRRRVQESKQSKESIVQRQAERRTPQTEQY